MRFLVSAAVGKDAARSVPSVIDTGQFSDSFEGNSIDESWWTSVGGVLGDEPEMTITSVGSCAVADGVGAVASLYGER